MTMQSDEKAIEKKLLDAILRDPEKAKIKSANFPEVANFRDLLDDHGFAHFRDTDMWNPCKDFMLDVIGNMIPDLVLRSTATGENRIIVEVKDQDRLADRHFEMEDSQVIRYFLHLLATSRKNEKDIHRAVILCAPSIWFQDPHNAKAWGYFLEHYSDLATKFGIVLGEIYSDKLA
jgi:hypothetical protein